jgi:hypothetical protein
MGKYDDIMDLPHHVSATRPRMSMTDRAAQFQPFRALTGYEDAVHEAARLTDERIELTEDEQARLDAELQKLADDIAHHPQVTVTYFQPDKKKAGGAYVAAAGCLKRIDDVEGALILMSGERIHVEDILEIQITEL